MSIWTNLDARMKELALFLEANGDHDASQKARQICDVLRSAPRILAKRKTARVKRKKAALAPEPADHGLPSHPFVVVYGDEKIVGVNPDPDSISPRFQGVVFERNENLSALMTAIGDLHRKGGRWAASLEVRDVWLISSDGSVMPGILTEDIKQSFAANIGDALANLARSGSTSALN